jgi:formaldehyde-activating enzyme involved in methanogenesis
VEKTGSVSIKVPQTESATLQNNINHKRNIFDYVQKVIKLALLNALATGVVNVESQGSMGIKVPQTESVTLQNNINHKRNIFDYVQKVIKLALLNALATGVAIAKNAGS